MNKMRLYSVVACALIATLTGCDQFYRGFARFQLVNQTSGEISYYGFASSQEALEDAPNLLTEPLGPDGVADANVPAPGNYWLRAVGEVNGQTIDRTVGPLNIVDGNKAWAWYEMDGQVFDGTDPIDIYALSNLPTIVIDTRGETIVDEPKIPSDMYIAYDPESLFNRPYGDPADYIGFAGIEIRGNSSQTFDKLSYGVETWDDEDDGIDVELLGFPEEEDWVFYGPWMDRSLMRNVVGYRLWASLGNYAPRTQFVEVYLNSDNHPVIEERYHGIYVLTERIKRDKQRVNIAKLDEDDIEPPAVTGGYILEMQAPDQLDPGTLSIDIEGNFILAIEEPDADDIADAQLEYITQYINDFEAALFGDNFTDPVTGYAAYIDVDNFIDYILFQDLSKNRDAFRSSIWMYKDREQKLKLGPVWDLNIAFGYFSFNGFQSHEGWILQQPKNDLPHSPWTDRLFQDPAFVQKYIARWKELRTTHFSDDALDALIDTAAAEIGSAHVRNFVRWDTLGKTLLPDIRFLMFLGPHPDSWQGEVEYLRSWIHDRAAWIDDNIDDLAL